MTSQLKTAKTFVVKHALDFAVAALGVMVLMTVLTPAMASASINPVRGFITGTELDLTMKSIANTTKEHGDLPTSDNREVAWSINVPITAYASVPEQTDDTPFIGAAGTHVYDGMIAANFLPLYTKVRIPELYGDKVFSVEDRMNSRYHYRMDIWMADNADAKRFGIKHATVEILND